LLVLSLYYHNKPTNAEVWKAHFYVRSINNPTRFDLLQTVFRRFYIKQTYIQQFNYHRWKCFST